MRLAPATLTFITLLFAGCLSKQAPDPFASPAATKTKSENSSSEAMAAAVDAVELTSYIIQTVVRSHFDELQVCYETTLAANNELAGIVELELTISRDGTIEKGRLLKDGIGSAELNLCLVKKMVNWKFPKHTDDSVTIEFPFAFSPKR